MNEILTSIRVGDVFVNEAAKVKVTEIRVSNVHAVFATFVTYTHEVCGRDYGKVTNRIEAFIEMLHGDDFVRPAASIAVNISDYRRSHGKNPRGWGRWVFSPYDPSLKKDFLRYAFSFTDTYGGARASAKKRVKAMYPGCDVLYVCA